MAGIILALPSGDGHRLVARELALTHQDSDQRRDHRLGRGEAEDRRIDAVTVRVTFGDDAAIPDHDDGLGATEWRLGSLGKRAVERCDKLWIFGRDQGGPGEFWQQRGLRMSVKWRRRKRDRRICVLEMASQTLAIDRMAAAGV